jgi:hypothetical protein
LPGAERVDASSNPPGGPFSKFFKHPGSLIPRLAYLTLSLSLVAAYVSIMHLASPRIFFAVKRVSVWEFFRMSWEPLPFLGVILTIPFLVLRERRLAAASILALGLMLPFNYDAQIVVYLCWLLLVMLLTRRSIDFNELLRMLSASTLFLTLVIIIHLVSYPFQPFENTILSLLTLSWVRLYATLQPLGALCYVLTPIGVFIPLYFQKLRSRSLGAKVNTGKKILQGIFGERASNILFPTALFLSIYLSVYSYLPRLNPELAPTGVDILSYAQKLVEINKSRDPVGFAFANCSDRPLFYLSLHALNRLTGMTVIQTLEAASAIWLTGLVASYYFLSLSLFNSRSMASLTALLATAGIQVSVGLYSSYQANMAALIIVNILSGIVLSWREGFLKNMLVSALSFLVPMFHPYTAVQYFGMLSLTLLYAFWRSRSLSFLKTLALILFSALLSNVFTSLMAYGHGSPPLTSAANVATRLISLDSLLRFTGETLFLFTTLYSSFIANSAYLVLTLHGLTSLLRVEMEETRRVFLTASSLTLLPLYATDGLTGSRLFLNLPSPVFSAVGACMFKNRSLSVLLIVLSLCFNLQAMCNLGVLTAPA